VGEPGTIESIAADPRVFVRRAGLPDGEGRCVVYWMQRAQRARDNPALDVAVRAANRLRLPVVAFFAPVPYYPGANLRHYTFLFQGVPDIAAGLARRGVGFVYRPHPNHSLMGFCEEVRPALVVGDENPLREPERWRQRAARQLRVPLWTVDADVIVPSRMIGREHFAARTIRPHIEARLPELLTPVADLRAMVPWVSRGVASVPTTGAVPARFPVDRSVAAIDGMVGGAAAGLRALRRFVRSGLPGYATRRNQPELDGTSRLSPFLHFGHLGPRQVALAVRAAPAPASDRRAFLEQLIVRRELAVNFCRFNPRYDRVASAEPWATRTLAVHDADRRPIRYSERQLEAAETHDPLWNAAQRQLVLSGWMHGYLRMYWAKKILEWSRSPGTAYRVAVRLNDRYELDGRDPNGYAGIAWAIGGKHDRAWGPERPIFGTVRYMSYESTRRKFDSRAYIERWAGGG
jgi:deoxyribodipyrimidine photo-lyase